jgi:hypothetical protein
MPRKWTWRGVVFKRRSDVGMARGGFFPEEKKDFEGHGEDAEKKRGEESGLWHQ